MATKTKTTKTDDKPKVHRDGSPTSDPSKRGLENDRDKRGLDGPRR